MCKCINETLNGYRLKINFFTPDRLLVARMEYTQVAKSIPEAIIKQIELLESQGYNRKEFVVSYIGSEL